MYVNEDIDVHECGLTETIHYNTWVGIKKIKWITPDKHTKGYTYCQI